MAQPAPFDVDNISIHDLSTEETPEESKDPDVEPEKPEEQPEETETESEGETPEADGAETEEDELTALGFPELPAELAENEDVTKRYLETQRGIVKLLNTQKSQVEALRPYAKYAEDLSSEDPNTRLAAYKHLGETLGIQATAPATPQETELPIEWANAGLDLGAYNEAKSAGLEYPGEYNAYRKALDAFEAKFGPRFEQMEKADAATAAEAAFKAKVAKEAKSTIGFLAKTEAGWGVTEQMVETAMRQFPDMDTAKAVKAAFPDHYAAHRAKRAVETAGKKGPEMPSGSGSSAKGATLIVKDDPADYTLADIAHNQAILAQ